MNKFRKAARDYFNFLLDHLIQFAILREPKVLHLIRIDIKKIRAIFHVIEFSTDKFNSKKQFAPLQNIFRSAAKIREPQVMNSLLLKYGVPALKTDLNFDHRSAIEYFIVQVPQMATLVLRRYISVKPSLTKVHGKDLNRYIRSMRKEIKSSIYPKMRMGKLHSVRKQLKEVIYLTEINPGLKEKPLQFYSTLENLIGSWHDKQSLIKALSSNKEFQQSQLDQLWSGCNREEAAMKLLVTNFFK